MAQGDIIEENRSCMVEELELWFCEPVECVKELLSNPAFKDYICYTPEHVYSDRGEKGYLMRCGRQIGGGKCRCIKLSLM